ncbi:MAG: hypothetical protein U0974_12105 [Gemmatimonadales bacterium]|nr:hypothetical protein [Gemmatimonadales bacterium]MDZ4390458.1 hypothetical protein [Gemmatimonadales bacterium]
MSLDRLTAALADRYRLERELGVGGMATVDLAADIKHDRQVAIKVLRPEVSDELTRHQPRPRARDEPTMSTDHLAAAARAAASALDRGPGPSSRRRPADVASRFPG